MLHPVAMLLQHQAQGCRLAIWRPHCFHNLSRPQSRHVGASSSRLTTPRHPSTSSHRRRQDFSSKRKQARCTKSSVGVNCQAEQPKATNLSIDVGGRQVGKSLAATSDSHVRPHKKIGLSTTSFAKQMTLETGEIGRQANGAVSLTYGDTVGTLCAFSSQSLHSKSKRQSCLQRYRDELGLK